MKEVNLTLTIDEANLILEGLGHLPFAKVFELVANIQQQASKQLNGRAGEAEDSRPPLQVEEADDVE